jgi:hypothetical protein
MMFVLVTGGQAGTFADATSPNGKYLLTLHKDLIISGNGTRPAILSSNFDRGEGVESVLWSSDSDKVVVTTRRVDSNVATGLVVVAWLDGNKWKEEVAPGTGDEPAHYRNDDQKVVRWVSADTFEMQNTITLNSGEKLPTKVYKVRITPSGLKALK